MSNSSSTAKKVDFSEFNKEEYEKAKKECKFDLNFHIQRLLKSEPFFGAMSRQITKIKSFSISTAGVCVNGNLQFVMYYNPLFLDKLSDKEIGAVIKHELYHIIFGHITYRKKDKECAKLWNYATDLAINSFLEADIPKFCLIPGVGQFAHLPKMESSDFYFKKLSEDLDKFEEMLKNAMANGEDLQFDDHETWQNGTDDPSKGNNGNGGLSRELIEERIKGMMQKAANQVSGDYGSISNKIRDYIVEKYLTTSIDWKKVLLFFVKKTMNAYKRNTIRKINKRFPYIHSGCKRERLSNIAISIDQSGSVGEELLSQFFAELDKLAEIVTFTVIPFDEEVFEEKVYVWKKGQKRKAERVLSGGTNFDSPTNYVNKRNFDGHIILTDMYAPKPVSSKCQRMWITDKSGKEKPYFSTNELVIAIEDRKSI